ncbi:hypothetical protein I314_00271 [Cryptococcus bacillisporus CA1873]|uniref:Unplaced genomic scaffold supercont1.5, whole genome shotgun sequence n=2 Tax=Cryptococcus gattii TaxID=552467 RepID=A0A0D0VSP7_CRYGA|nr:hypothetical protein I312_02234 [Cryptococcus bacillisporus CA1280]KIR69167.1 hypothetical protein I314_00271 [Cryptococcus bacillisporus CA1873]|eukprot:KIR69167.1 hypothetical protein I314_00271 [Cryptococcus gattii CA1873]
MANNEISMEDMSTPTPAPSHMSTSRKSSLGHSHPPISQHSTVTQSQAQSHLGALTMEMSSEMIDKLSLLDKILDSAQSAKQALLRGEEIGVSTNLGDISNHLEVASELGVGPVQTPRDTTTPNSQTSQQSTSPTGNYLQSSSAVQTNVTAAPPQYQMSMASTAVPSQLSNLQMTVQSSLLPSLPVDQNATGTKRSATVQSINNSVSSGSKLATAEFLTGKLQAPPLTHAHSFPNGHQLPSQLTGTLPPTTPAVPSPSFIASIGAQHMPMISSPLATIPPSRPPSPPRYTLPAQPWDGEIASMDVGLQQNGPGNASTQHSGQQMIERRLSTSERIDGRPIVRGRSTSLNKGWSHTAMTSSVPPSAWQSRAGSPVEDGDEDDDSDDDEPRRTKRRRSSVGADGLALDQANGGISDDIRGQLDQIFEEFLNRICSDLDVCDSKGEKIHQVLMPKKMQKLDESTDYRPFKFRIQAFTNAFAENLQQRGITEEIMSIKKIKNYLWRQDLISRFNPDGKKAKSKGNHIWNVDAKKLPGGGWVFRPFQRRIIGQPNNFAVVNQPYEWEPRIWDPQAASDTLHPKFSSPPGSLPHWLRWEDGVRLVGIPDQSTAPFQIQVHAEFIDGSGNHSTLDAGYPCQVVSQLLPVTDNPSGPQQVYGQPLFNPSSQPHFEYLNHSLPGLGIAPSAQQIDLQFANNLMYTQPGTYPA